MIVRLLLFCSILLSPLLLRAQEGMLLHQRADSLYKISRYADAITQYTAAQRYFLPQKDWAAYLRCQTSIGQSLVYLSQFKAAEDTLRKGERLFESRLARKKNAPLATLYDIRLSLANILASTGRLEQAITLLLDLRQKIDRELPDNHVMLARIEFGIGFSRTSQGSNIEARDHLFKSLKAFRTGGALETQAAMFAFFGLGQVHENLNDYDSALECYAVIDKWVQKQQRVAPHIVALLHNALGRAYTGIGDYQLALEHHERALSYDRKIFGYKNRATINDIQRMGNVCLLRNEWANALTHYRLALVYFDSLYTMPLEGRATIFSKMAAAYAGQAQPDTAKMYWDKALAEVARLPPPNNMSWDIRQGLANFYFQQGKYSEALAELKAIESTLTGQAESRVADLCRVNTLIGRVLIRQQRYDEALDQLQHALALQCRPGVQLEPYENPTKEQILLSENTLPTFSYKAEALFLKSASGAQRRQNLTLVLKTCQYAIQLGEQFRQNLRRNRYENFEWISRYQTLFNTGMAAAHALYLLTKDPAYWQQAFMLADQSKALLLSEGLQNAEAKSFAGIPWSMVREELGLAQAIAYQERAVMEASAKKDPTVVAAETQKLLDKRQEYDALIKRMEAEYPYYFEQKYRPLRASAAEIQATLAPDALFIEYQPDQQNGLLYIFTISKRQGLQLTIERLDDDSEARITELNDLLQSIYLPRQDKHEQFVRISSALYEQYMAPIEHLLPGKKRLIVVGGGSLNYLPLEVLVKSNAVLPYHDLNYLVRRVSVAYHYSAALYLRLLRRGAQHTEAGMLMFAPTFPEQPMAISEAVGRSPVIPFRTLVNADSSVLRAFPPLPYAAEEVRRISALFKDQPIIMLIGEQATKTSLRAALQRPRHIVHIASHSFADALLPKFSGIACAFSAHERSLQDSILYAGELYNMTIPADLVVLSSCESGSGKINANEGLLGLNRSFIYAGASNIIFSLWRASDQATSDFMVEFYRQLAAKQVYPAALRAAKLKMIDDPSLASPNFWAGFLLIGR
jgi:CHAT domain-containing protein